MTIYAIYVFLVVRNKFLIFVADMFINGRSLRYILKIWFFTAVFYLLFFYTKTLSSIHCKRAKIIFLERIFQNNKVEYNFVHQVNIIETLLASANHLSHFQQCFCHI